MNNEKKLVANGIDKVFEHRKNFIVVGLTGRTGSGCSTAANILATSNFSALNIPSIKNPPESHEDRKLRIISLWAKEHWHSFKIISVTAVILSLALSEGVSDFLNQVESSDTQTDKNALEEILNSYVEDSKSSLLTISRIKNKDAVTNDEIYAAARFFSIKAISLASDFKALFKDRINIYTEILQCIGNNLRRSGRAFIKDPSPDNIFLIPKTIADISDLYRIWMESDNVSQKVYSN